MTTGNTTAAPALGVLADIMAHMRDITPEMLVPPTEPVKEGRDHVVAIATDDIKRLYIARRLIGEKGKKLLDNLVAAAENVEEFIIAADAAGTLDALDKDVETPGTKVFAMREQIEKMDSEVHAEKALREIVDGVMWLEIKRQHPDLATKPNIGIRSGWELCWTADDKEKCPHCGGYHGNVDFGQILASLNIFKSH